MLTMPLLMHNIVNMLLQNYSCFRANLYLFGVKNAIFCKSLDKLPVLGIGAAISDIGVTLRSIFQDAIEAGLIE